MTCVVGTHLSESHPHSFGERNDEKAEQLGHSLDLLVERKTPPFGYYISLGLPLTSEKEDTNRG